MIFLTKLSRCLLSLQEDFLFKSPFYNYKEIDFAPILLMAFLLILLILLIFNIIFVLWFCTNTHFFLISTTTISTTSLIFSQKLSTTLAPALAYLNCHTLIYRRSLLFIQIRMLKCLNEWMFCLIFSQNIKIWK